MVTKLISEFERTVLTKDQYAQRTGKDQGEDLNVDGPGTSLGIESGANMMLDIVNLVDFYEGNELWTGSKDSSTNATSYSYRVTARGMADDKVHSPSLPPSIHLVTHLFLVLHMRCRYLIGA